jgi:soluble lytic murein transglycosylase-like protein
MDIVSIILNTAKTVQVSGTLLLAICSHESNNFTMNYSHYDHGSPSYGYCQVKIRTAIILGFKGSPKELIEPKTNSYYAAKYLKSKEEKYGEDWVKMTAAYNAGVYNPSNRVLGCPRNLKYIKKVQKKLPVEFQEKLNCGKKKGHQ